MARTSPTPARRESFESQVTDGVLVVRSLVSEMKAPEAERLIELVFDEFEGDEVVLNLTPVGYINSTVMSALSRVAVAKNLRVVGLQAPVQGILDTMGLLQFLDMAPSEEDAIKSLRGG